MAIRLYQFKKIDENVLDQVKADTKTAAASKEDKADIRIPYHTIRILAEDMHRLCLMPINEEKSRLLTLLG